MPQAAVLEKLAGQGTHLDQETQVPTLCRRTASRSLKDLDHPHNLLVDLQGGQDEKVFRGISRVLVVRRSRFGWHQSGLAACQDVLQQRYVPPLMSFILVERIDGKVDLVLNFQFAAVRRRPDGAALRRQCRYDASQELLVELLQGGLPRG